MALLIALLRGGFPADYAAAWFLFHHPYVAVFLKRGR